MATSGVENVHVNQTGKGDATTKSKEKSGGEGGSRLEREVILSVLLFLRPLIVIGPRAQS